MASMSWSSELSVGVQVLDDDHKKLIAMINELHAAMLQSRSNDVLGGILRRLAAYTVEHFGREEQLFVKTGYFAAVGHRREHDKLKAQVMADIEKFESGTFRSLGLETLNFLCDWLKHHILESDKKYTAHFNEHGVH